MKAPADGDQPVMVVDLDRCIACGACKLACQLEKRDRVAMQPGSIAVPRPVGSDGTPPGEPAARVPPLRHPVCVPRPPQLLDHLPGSRPKAQSDLRCVRKPAEEGVYAGMRDALLDEVHLRLPPRGPEISARGAAAARVWRHGPQRGGLSMRPSARIKSTAAHTA